MKDHQVKIIVGQRDGLWEITIEGVTSGAEVHFGDGDSGSVRFRLDASRFEPVIVRR